MTIKQLMERVGITETGRAVAYIKDGLEEINLVSETHLKTQRLDITKNKRFYEMPNDCLQIKNVRALNHLNSKSEYRTIPRLLYEPVTKDGDGE